MKKNLSLLLALLLLLAVLPACGDTTEPVPDEDPPSVCVSPAAPPAQEALLAISAAAPDEPEDGPEVLTDQLADYMELAYGLTADDWTDCAVLRAGGMRAYEMAMVYCEDEETAGKVEIALTDYLTAREGAFTGYAPEEAALVANGKVCRWWIYVGLFICEDSETAGEQFIQIVKNDILPEPIEKTEAAPEPAKYYVSAALQPAADVIAEVCADEIAEINAAGGMVSVAAANATAGFAEMAEETYGLTPDQWTDGFVIQPILSTGVPFELTVFCMADEDAAETGTEALDTYWGNLHDKYSEMEDGVRVITEENVEAYQRVSGARLICRNLYVAFFMCQNSEVTATAFNNALSGMTAVEQSEPAAPVQEQDAIELGFGVSFVPVPWKDAEGDPDPDHPGRIRFTMPDSDPYMTLYDTSSIAAAWQSGDPSSLSAYDRAIYDEAKAVLDEIIQPNMTDFEKEAEIYAWVLQNIDYAYVNLDVLVETDRDAYTPYGGLINHDAVCLGYASTFQLLTELSGIESLTVIGAGQNSTEPHGWAMVKLNGEWYCADPTWDWSFCNLSFDSPVDPTAREWRFFNTTSDYMARTGHQWDYDAVPEAAAEDHGWR